MGTELSTMLHFQKSSWIQAPLERVWQFHAHNPRLLIPPWQPVQMIRQPAGIEIGAITEYRLWLGLLPIQWVNVVTAIEPQRQFTEQQQTGPMPTWQHCHTFQAQGEATLLTDEIHFELPGGDLAAQGLAGWVNARLSDMFDYRHRTTSQFCRQF
jgi:ligand-binding SRPBCC domain-containing protein